MNGRLCLGTWPVCALNRTYNAFLKGRMFAERNGPSKTLSGGQGDVNAQQNRSQSHTPKLPR